MVLTLSPAYGPPTTRLTANGSGFGETEMINLTFDGVPLARARTDATGAFSRKARVPKAALPGDHTVTATGETSGLVAQATFGVHTDWPMFQFSLDRVGANPYENVLGSLNVSGLVQDWSASLDTAAWGSPSVAGGSVFVGDYDGNLNAFQASTGAQLWERSLGNQAVTAPAVSGGVVYVGVTLNAKVAAVDADTGAVLWSRIMPRSVFSSPAVVGGRVYVGTGAGLYALDANTGSTIWSASKLGIANTPPTVAGRTVYIVVDDPLAKLVALDARSGAKLWSTDLIALTSNAAAYADGVLYVGTNNGLDYGDLFAVDAASHRILWTFPGSFLAVPVIRGGRIYVPAWNGPLYALDAKTGQVIWSASDLDPIYRSLAWANGVLYAGSCNAVSALDPQSGTILWQQQTTGCVESPAVSDGVLYAASFSPDDSVYAFHLP